MCASQRLPNETRAFIDLGTRSLNLVESLRALNTPVEKSINSIIYQNHKDLPKEKIFSVKLCVTHLLRQDRNLAPSGAVVRRRMAKRFRKRNGVDG